MREAQIICVDRSFALCGGRWRRLRKSEKIQKLSKNQKHLTSDFPKEALDARFGVAPYLGRQAARRPERLGNQRGRVRNPDAKWLYQALGVGRRVKQEQRARLAKHSMLDL